jgi:non-homologous end joining protein Ku
MGLSFSFSIRVRRRFSICFASMRAILSTQAHRVESVTCRNRDFTERHPVHRDKLVKLIEEKVTAPGHAVKSAKAPRKATNVVDLVSVLQQSLNAHAKGEEKAKKSKGRAHPPHRKAA